MKKYPIPIIISVSYTHLKRLSGRRVCSACGASYHTIYKPSKQPDVCDRCTGPLIVRKDDEPATILERLNAVSYTHLDVYKRQE